MTLITETPKTILLLTVDCLRADTAAGSMPFLQRLAEDGFTATNCHTVGSGTPTSMPGLMQSRLPTDNGGEPKAHTLPESTPTLAEVLNDSGIGCAGWHSNVYTSRKFGYHRGFDVFSDLKSDPVLRTTDTGSSTNDGETSWLAVAQRLSDKLGVEPYMRSAFYRLRNQGLIDYRPHVRAEEVSNATTTWFPNKADGTPRFAWLHYMDLHSPYTPPSDYREQINGCPTNAKRMWTINEKLRTRPQDLTTAEIDSLKSLYVAGAKYVDDQIAKLVDSVKKKGLWNETLLIITSDHGEMFGDRSIPDDYAFQHPNYLGEIVTHVPLLFAGGCVERGSSERLVSNMDIAPTILKTLDISIPEEWHGNDMGGQDIRQRERIYSVTGRGTRQDNKPGAIPEETLHVALRTADHATLWWSFADQEAEYYSRTDGEERLIESTALGEEQIERIEERFGEVVEQFAFDTDTESELDSETSNRLRDLGYIE